MIGFLMLIGGAVALFAVAAALRFPAPTGRHYRELMMRHEEECRAYAAKRQKELERQWVRAFGRPRLTVIRGGKTDDVPPAGETV